MDAPPIASRSILESLVVRRTVVGLTFGLALVLMGLLPSKLEGLPRGFATPILALEFARGPADLLACVGGGSAAMGAIVEAYDRAHLIDFVFAFAYASLLAVGGASLLPRGGRATTFVLGLSVVAALADCTENVLLLEATRLVREGSAPASFAPLVIATSTKWGAIAFAAAIVGALMPTPGWLRNGLRGCSGVAGGAFVVALFHPAYAAEVLSLAILGVFVLLGVGVVRRVEARG